MIFFHFPVFAADNIFLIPPAIAGMSFGEGGVSSTFAYLTKVAKLGLAVLIIAIKTKVKCYHDFNKNKRILKNN